MKIKEALINCINAMDNNKESFAFVWFIVEVSQFYVYLAGELLEKDMPEARFNDENTGGKGKKKEKVTAKDILRVLGRDDILRHMSIFLQSLGFFEWFINQDVPVNIKDVDGCFLSWNDLDFLATKWNEYLVIATEEGK